MTDLVERLRSRPGPGLCQDCFSTVMEEAADKIEKLETECSDLVVALVAMLDLYGKPHREAWLSHKGWEEAIIITERAQTALAKASFV